MNGTEGVCGSPRTWVRLFNPLCPQRDQYRQRARKSEKGGDHRIFRFHRKVDGPPRPLRSLEEREAHKPAAVYLSSGLTKAPTWIIEASGFPPPYSTIPKAALICLHLVYNRHAKAFANQFLSRNQNPGPEVRQLVAPGQRTCLKSTTEIIEARRDRHR
jgi:hypothetical protein